MEHLYGDLVAIIAGSALVIGAAMGVQGCGEADPVRSVPPGAIVTENQAQHEAVVAHIASYEQLRGPVDLSRWVIHVRELPGEGGYVDRKNGHVVVHPHNGAGWQDVAEALQHELEHVTAPYRAHPFPLVDESGRETSEWIMRERGLLP